MAKQREEPELEPMNDIKELESAYRMNEHILKALKSGTYQAKDCPLVADAMAMTGNMMIQINSQLSSLRPKSKKGPAGKRKAPAKKPGKGKKK